MRKRIDRMCVMHMRERKVKGEQGRGSPKRYQIALAIANSWV